MALERYQPAAHALTMVWLAALLLLGIAASNYFLHRDTLYPGFLQASVWSVAIALFALYQDRFIPVSGSVFVLFVLGALFFSLGSFVASAGHRPHLQRNYLNAATLPRGWVVVVLGAVVVVGLLFYVRRAMQLGAEGPSQNPFVNLRWALTFNEAVSGGYGILLYLPTLAYLLVAILLLKRLGVAAPRARLWSVALAIAMAFVFGILSSGRSVLLPLLVLIIVIPAVLRVVSPVKTAGVLVVITALMFVAFGFALGKGANLTSSLTDNMSTLWQSFLTYALGPIPAFQTYLDGRGPDVDFGTNVLRSIVAVFNAIGIAPAAAPVVQPYADVPAPINVYTVYLPYTKDFGVAGGILALFVLGFVHGVLYRHATTRDPHAVYVFLFVISLYPLAMQIFQDMYFTLLSLWIQQAVYAIACFVVLNDSRRWLRWPTPAATVGTPGG